MPLKVRKSVGAVSFNTRHRNLYAFELGTQGTPLSPVEDANGKVHLGIALLSLCVS